MGTPHTPGPWTIETKKHYSCDHNTGETRSTSMYWIGKISYVSAHEADTRLISASPCMLEALELLLRYEGSRDNEGLNMLDMARLKAAEAIKKAKGEL